MLSANVSRSVMKDFTSRGRPPDVRNVRLGPQYVRFITFAGGRSEDVRIWSAPFHTASVSGAEAVRMQSRSSVRPLPFHTGSVCSARLNSVFCTEWANSNLILNTIGLDLLLELFISLCLFYLHCTCASVFMCSTYCR